MAKLPPKKSEDSTGDWLNTYADMVTLLLTFFVLLFACSNLDETKLQFVYQAFQMRGKYINPIVADQGDPNAEMNGGITDDATNAGGEGTMPQSYPEMYQYLAEFIDSNSLSANVSVENSAAYLTLRFDSSVFFDGDSHILKEEGRQMLVKFAPMIHAMDPHIKKLTVVGHTSVGSSNVSDWNLSSLRACSVTNFLESGVFENLTVPVIDPSKFSVKGCGNTEPRFPNDTEEGRQKNRRVELMMLKDDLDLTDSDVIQDILKHDWNLDTEPFDEHNPNKDQNPSTLPDGSADKIVDFIESKFKGDGATHVGTMGPGAIDGSMFIASDASDTSGDEG
ncbi:MAG: OmpA family protein [Oscillospiraceae bacterium]|nr:OmpA family protein [Oscillospiraceae bacterium]